MKDEGNALLFYVMSILTAIWFFIWSIADFADCNGFVMVDQNFKAERGAAGGIGIVAALGSLIIGVFAILNAILFYKR